MSDVKSKNLYELLGNTSDQDSDREPDVVPTKTADKPAARSGKRDAPKNEPVEPQGNPERFERTPRGGRRGGHYGNEEAFRDRTAGSGSNRSRPTGDRQEEYQGRGGRGGRGRGARGGRGGGGRGADYERHSRTGISEHPKQADKGWGAPTGEAEWNDEKAGDAIATEEVKGGGWDADVSGAPGWSDGAAAAAPTGESGWDAGNAGAAGFTDSAAPPETNEGVPAEGATQAEEAESEDKNKSYADYMAEQLAKKTEGLGVLEARKPNEGSRQDKKWSNAKPITKGGDEEYFQGAENKARRERDRLRNAKERLEVDFNYKENDTRGRGGGRGRGRGERGDRGGRGRGRGDFTERSEGSFRGDRGEGGYRGDRGDRGEGGYRGRGEFRGRGRGRGRGEGGESAPVAVNDESAFPSLGGGKK